MVKKNIVITGFMGTGKSTIGRNIAQKLDWPFVDLDSLLEERQGHTIRSIFETEGEAHFRQLETELCYETAQWSGYVIATGGGTLVNPKNFDAFGEQSLLICLECDLDDLWLRLRNARNRPMLDSQNPKARIAALLKQRQPAYDRIKYRVNTARRPLDATVSEIIALWQQINHET